MGSMASREGINMTLWSVWRTTYATYAELEAHGNKSPVLIRAGLTFEAARKLVNELGVGYYMKEST